MNTRHIVGLCFLLFTLVRCHTTRWNSIDASAPAKAPDSVIAIFNEYPNGVMTLKALNPAYNYKFDIGEKDNLYGRDSLSLRFTKVELTLHDQMPQGKDHYRHCFY